MNRTAFGVDRLVLALLGSLLLAVGVWLFAWVTELLPGGWWSPSTLAVGLDPDATEAGWWPAALIFGGLVLVGIGGSWLMSHFRRTTVDRLSLASGAGGGRLVLDGSALVDGMAVALTAADVDILGAGGRLVEQKGRLVLDMTASVRGAADLSRVTHACDDVAAHVLRSTGREDLTCRVRLKVANRPRPASRVH